MSENRTVKILVPNNVHREEVNVVADIILQSLLENGFADSEKAVKVVEPKFNGAIGGVEAMLLLLIIVPSKWFTQKWADEYLWPMVRKQIDKPSQALVKWISSLLEELGSQ